MKIAIAQALKHLPMIDYRTLKEFQGNLKDLTKQNYAKLKKSLEEFGFIVPMFLWKHEGEWKILDAHQRVRVLIKENAEPYELPYIEIEAADETDAKKKLLVISSQYGHLTQEGLDAFAFDIDDTWIKDTINFDSLNFAMDVPDEVAGGLTDPDDVPEAPKEPVTKKGDIWILGDHRVMCGDSTNEADVEKLMGNERATCVFTDPPYGLSIGKKNVMLNTFQKAGRCLDNLDMDDMPPAELGEMLLKVFTLFKTKMANDCSVFVCSPQGGGLGMMMMQKSGLEVRHILNWIKNSPTFSMGRLDYDYQHEPILFTWVKTHKRKKEGAFQTSLWEVDKPRENKEHPTMKPVQLPVNAILNHTDKGDIVGDPFLGSGTTIIAAEQTGRKGRGLEISPAYCDVIKTRWETFTGKKAERETKV